MSMKKKVKKLDWSKNELSFCSITSEDLKVALKKIKEDLTKNQSCDKNLKEFSSRKVLSSKDNFFNILFKPLTNKDFNLSNCKTPSERQEYIKSLWKKYKKDDAFMGVLRNITEWYFLDEKEDFQDYARFKSFVFFCDLMRKTHVPIKLILTRLSQDINVVQGAYCNYNTEYGATHAGLQIGPWLIDWNNGEIILPRPLRIKHPLLVLDIPKSKTPCTPAFFKAVADICWEWNTQFHYDLTTSSFKKVKKSKKSNCHGFVKYFTRTMTKNGYDMKLDWFESNGVIETYMSSLKRLDKRCRKKLKMTSKKDGVRYTNFLDFKSHKELHGLIKSFLGCELKEIIGYSGELFEKAMLLKSFDRSFWYGKSECKNDEFNYKTCPLIFSKIGVFGTIRGGGEEDKDGMEKKKEERKKEEEEMENRLDVYGENLMTIF